MPHTSIIEHWLQDLRFAIRQLVGYRGYGAAAVIVPALGIAASVALFGFVDAAMIRPLPYGEPARLFTIFGTTPDLAAGRSRGKCPPGLPGLAGAHSHAQLDCRV